jgi:hypothetical protein
MNIAPCLRLNSLASAKGGDGRGEEVNPAKIKIPSPQTSPRLGRAREKNQL